MTTVTSANAFTATPGEYLTCGGCLNRFRVELLGHSLQMGDRLSTGTGAKMFCPYCGASPVNRVLDPDEDYWYSLTLDLGFPYDKRGVEIVKGLFDIWDRDAFHNFGAFVAAFKEGKA